MPRPRKALVSLDATQYYHCVSRCVRRAFLCGKDKKSGVCFEHRRQWIEDRLLKLPTVFAIDVASYAVLSNHYHVVLHVDRDKAMQWSAKDVVQRWHQLFKGNSLSQRFLQGEILAKAEIVMIDNFVEAWRSRLIDISWFMRIVNEGIAREANREDKCTGRFWEGRFKSQALLDEKALVACSVYVDLNPIRANMAKSPETSDHTSVKRRIQHTKSAAQPNHPKQQVKGLLPFAGNPRKDIPKGLPFRLTDYLELVDWTARIVRDDKRGAMSDNYSPILERLQIEPAQWLTLTTRFESRFKVLVGASHKVKLACEQLGQRWAHGIQACQEAFPT
jgi:hypothetical protein